MSAIALVTGVLAQNFGSNNVKVYSAVAMEGHLHETKNLLLVSGPRWNPVTERFIGLMGSPLRFDRTSDSVILEREEHSTTVYSTVYRANGRADICYGIILIGSIDTADHRKQNAVICAGINNISTFGSAVYLMGLQNTKEASRILAKKGDSLKNRCDSRTAILLRVFNVEPSSEAISNVPLDPSQVNIEVVEVLGAECFGKPYVYRY